MEYRYTDTDETPIIVNLTLRDVARLRRALAFVKLADSGAENSERYAAEDVDRFLRRALEKATEALENEARSMRERFERGDI